jgi:hypothetical protein
MSIGNACPLQTERRIEDRIQIPEGRTRNVRENESEGNLHARPIGNLSRADRASVRRRRERPESAAPAVHGC